MKDVYSIKLLDLIWIDKILFRRDIQIIIDNQNRIYIKLNIVEIIVIVFINNITLSVKNLK